MIDPDKPALRRELIARRQHFAGGAVRTAPMLADRLGPGMIVASFVPIRGEADPAPLVDVAVATGCRIALPHTVSRAAPLRFLAFAATDDLVPGPFGLRQPDPRAPDLLPDVILTPLVGFDRRGNRLGHGAGHYDRAFAAFPRAWRIGVAWSVQEVPALPTDPWDVPLQAIATEREWIVP